MEGYAIGRQGQSPQPATRRQREGFSVKTPISAWRPCPWFVACDPMNQSGRQTLARRSRPQFSQSFQETPTALDLKAQGREVGRVHPGWQASAIPAIPTGLDQRDKGQRGGEEDRSNAFSVEESAWLPIWGTACSPGPEQAEPQVSRFNAVGVEVPGRFPAFSPMTRGPDSGTSPGFCAASDSTAGIAKPGRTHRWGRLTTHRFRGGSGWWRAVGCLPGSRWGAVAIRRQ